MGKTGVSPALSRNCNLAALSKGARKPENLPLPISENLRGKG